MLKLRSMRFVAVLGVCALLLPPLANRALALGQRAPAAAGGPVTIFSGWAGTEKADFAAITNYCDAHYGTKTTYQQAAGDLATELATRVQSGNPPDLAALSVTGDISQYVKGNALKPLTFLNMAKLKKAYGNFWVNEGLVGGKLYAVYMKADVKSLVWYSPKKLKAGKYGVPKTWSQIIATSKKMIKAGKQPWAFGATDGWTLTDFLENIYLQLYGPAKYKAWYQHKISWTDPTIKKAFSYLNQIIGNSKMIAGGRTRALGQRWDAGAKQMVQDPKAEFFQEATFVGAGLRGDLPNAVEGKDYSAFAFPALKSWPATPVEVGPNGIVMFKDTPGSRALITCLTDPKALAQWAKLGGYISPNINVPASAYPDALTRGFAKMLAKAAKANLVMGDASDEMPHAIGSVYEFTELQKYFQNPGSLNTVLNELESKAKQVFGH